MRLIDADAYEYPGDLINEPTLTYDDIVPRAKWILNNYGSGTCGRCHKTQKGVWDYDHYQNYCGCCGAKMDLEEE